MSKKASRDTEQYVVRGGDSGSYDVLSGPYDSQEYWTDLNNVELASEHTGSRRTAGYPDSGGYYPLDEPELTPEVEAEMAAIKRRIESWKEGGDEDALDGAIGHYNSLADDYGLPRYGYDKPHYASAPEGVYNDDGEPLGFDYPSDPGEDDSNDEDEWYDDYAHEAKVERHAISDEFDLRPLHSRVATAFLKKG